MSFQLKKYSYKALRQMNMNERLALAGDQEVGRWLLTLLTPSQFIELFPSYYRQGLPDISGFLRAMPSTMSAAKQEAMEEQLKNTASGSAAGANMAAGGWRKKWQEKMTEQQETATPSRAGTTPPPQLSPSQRKIWDELRQSPVALDDPRAKMFSGLSPEQMNQVGISKIKKDGKEFFQYTPPKVSLEEAKSSMTADTGLGSASRKYESGNRGVHMVSTGAGDAGGVSYGSHQLASKTGTMANFLSSPDGAPYASRFAGLKPGSSGFNAVYRQIANDDPKGFETAQHAFITRTHYDPAKNYAAKLGYDTSDRRVQEALFSIGVQHGGANKIIAAAGSGAGRSPEEQVHALFNARRNYVDQQGLSYLKSRYASEERDVLAVSGYTGGGDYTSRDKELAQERLIRRFEEQRIGSLAEFTTANLPVPGSKEAKELVGDEKTSAEVAKNIKEKYGNLSNQQCVALAKAYVGSNSPVTDWRRGTNVMDGTMKPGTPIATFMDRSGNPSQLYDGGQGVGKPGNHTTHAGIFLGYERDGSGKITGIKVMEQYTGSGGAREKTYPIGGSGTSNGANYYSVNDTQGRPVGEHNPMLQAQTQVVDTSAPPRTTPNQMAPQVETPQPVAKPGPEKYTVNVPKFISAIKDTKDFKDNALSWMASDSMILSGFNDDARVKAAGVYLDPQGVMHFKNGMTPDVKKVMADFDSKSFMTKIEEKKKEEKKPEVKPTEQKPVEAPPVTTPNQMAPQVETPQVEKAPAKVKTNAAGGNNRVDTDQIKAYPIGGLQGDNAVVVNKDQKPLFTMNTNEAISMDPNTKTATVEPNKKERKVGEQRSGLDGMFSEFNRTVQEMASKFDQNKPVPDIKERPDAFGPEGDNGSWLNNLNKSTENEFKSPSVKRAFYRAGGGNTGEPNSGYHFSHGNKS